MDGGGASRAGPWVDDAHSSGERVRGSRSRSRSFLGDWQSQKHAILPSTSMSHTLPATSSRPHPSTPSIQHPTTPWVLQSSNPPVSLAGNKSYSETGLEKPCECAHSSQPKLKLTRIPTIYQTQQLFDVERSREPPAKLAVLQDVSNRQFCLRRVPPGPCWTYNSRGSGPTLTSHIPHLLVCVALIRPVYSAAPLSFVHSLFAHVNVVASNGENGAAHCPAPIQGREACPALNDFLIAIVLRTSPEMKSCLLVTFKLCLAG